VATLTKDIDFAAPAPGAAAPSFSAGSLSFHMFFIIKKNAVHRPSTDDYKYGIHILIPGIKLTRPYKKWLLKNFKSDRCMCAILQDLGAVGDVEECLDQNSASVPVLFFGSCKRASVPYVLGAAFEITIGVNSWSTIPVVKKVPESDLAGYNLVAEMSLTVQAAYTDGRKPLVTMMEFEAKKELMQDVLAWAERSANGAIQSQELVIADHELATLVIDNPEAERMHIMLNLLTPDYYTERGKWRDVIFAIANTSPLYKPLAVWFSQKCPDKWISGGDDSLDTIWDNALAGSNTRPLTVRSLAHWAKTSNPQAYSESIEKSYHTLFNNYIFKHKGKLEHYMVAKVLQAMVGSKYCVDIDIGHRGPTLCWFEFVTPNDTMEPGEVWKWRKEIEPSNVLIYISEKLTLIADNVLDQIEAQKAAATDENLAKYYKALIKSFTTSRGNMYNTVFKNGVIREANSIFRRRGFANKLDNDPNLFGTANGVLKLGRNCELIDYYHEFAISKFTPVTYARFNPHHPTPWQKTVLDAIENIIIEPDARDWILYHSCQGLSGDPKEGLFLLWDGGGQNGKTTYLRSVAKALGPYANKFNIQLMCSEREDADRPNSAVMAFKTLRFAYSEESNKSQALNVARMKEMVNAGEISGRELNKKQETFTMKANLVAASQYSFIVNTTDHGTWRRIRHYTSKAKFRSHPDPTNPYEKQEDQRFVCQYPTDPNFQSAMLSILAYYYERLQNEHNGELKNVRSPTIERETENFRVEQDSIHRWISQYVVVSPSDAREYTLSELADKYLNWYQKNIDRKIMFTASIIAELEASALSKYIRPSCNNTLKLKGCRLLGETSEEIMRSDERFITELEYRRSGGDGGAATGAVVAPPVTTAPAAAAAVGATAADTPSFVKPGTTKWWLPPAILPSAAAAAVDKTVEELEQFFRDDTEMNLQAINAAVTCEIVDIEDDLDDDIIDGDIVNVANDIVDIAIDIVNVGASASYAHDNVAYGDVSDDINDLIDDIDD
jgi:phage/plasmid-associated DNA primase